MSLRSTIGDFADAAGQTIKRVGKGLVSELFTNRDDERGIKDYDKFQAKEKQLNNKQTTDDQRSLIYQQMKDEDIVDMDKYATYYQKQQEDYLKKHPVNEVEQKNQAHLDEFKEKLDKGLADKVANSKTRYQQEVYSKASQELMKDYTRTYDNVMKTYEDTKDENLLKEREGVKDEYQDLIINSSQSFAEDIDKGMSYKEAYKNLIAKDKDAANRLVDIQHEMEAATFRSARQTHFDESVDAASKGEIFRMMKNQVKLIGDTIGSGISRAGRGIEEGKQMLGYYDTLEELANLNVYEEGAGFVKKAFGTVGSMAFEIFDGLPQILPEVATFIAGNKLAAPLKVSKILTKALKARKLSGVPLSMIENSSRIAVGITDQLADMIILDTVFQPSMGRPMTADDVNENMMFNIPINIGMASLGRGLKLAGKGLPNNMLTNTHISKELLAFIGDNKNGAEDVARQIRNEAANPTFNKEIEIASLPKNVQAKVKEAQAMALDTNARIASGMPTIEDYGTFTTSEKIAATRGKNIRAQQKLEPGKNFYEIANERAKEINKQMKAAFTSEKESFLPKLQAGLIVNLAETGKLNAKQILKAVDAVKTMSAEGDNAKKLVKAIFTKDSVLLESVLDATPKGKDGFAVEQGLRKDIKRIYNTITNELVVKNADNVLSKGDVVGKYMYDGEGFKDILSQQQVPKDTILAGMSETSAEFSTIDRVASASADVDSARESIKDLPKGKSDITDMFGFYRGLDADGKRLFKFPEGEQTGQLRQVVTKGTPTYSMMTNIFKKMGFEASIDDAGNFLVEGSRDAVARYKQGLDSLRRKGIDYSMLTDNQMNTIKILYGPEYIESYKVYVDSMAGTATKPVPVSQYKSWFEAQYKAGEDVHTLELQNINRDQTQKEFANMLEDGATYQQIEAQAATNITENEMVKAAGQHYQEGLISSVMRKTLTLNEIEPPKELVSEITNTIAGMKWSNGIEKKQMIEIVSNTIGTLISDPASLKTLTDTASPALYSSIVGRLIFKSEVAGKRYFEIISKQLKANPRLAGGFKELTNKIDEITETSKLPQPVGGYEDAVKYNKLKLFKEYSDITDLTDVDNFKKNYTKYRDNKVFDMKIEGATNTNIEDIAKRVAYDSLGAAGYPTNKLGIRLSKNLSNTLLALKDQYPDMVVKMNKNKATLHIGEDVINLSAITDIDVNKTLTSPQHSMKKTYATNVKSNPEETTKKLKQMTKDYVESTKEIKSKEGKDILNKVSHQEDIIDLDNLPTQEKTINNLYGKYNALLGDNITESVQIEKVIDELEDAILYQEAAGSMGKAVNSEHLMRLEGIADTYRTFREMLLKGKEMTQSEFTEVLNTKVSKIDPIEKEYMITPDKKPNLTNTFKMFGDQITAIDRPNSFMLDTKKAYERISKAKNSSQVNVYRAIDLMANSVNKTAEHFGFALDGIIPRANNIDISMLGIGQNILDYHKKFPNSDLGLLVVNRNFKNILEKYGKYSKETIATINSKVEPFIQGDMLAELKTVRGQDLVTRNVLLEYQKKGVLPLEMDIDKVVAKLPNVKKGELANAMYNVFDTTFINPKELTSTQADNLNKSIGIHIADIVEEFNTMKGIDIIGEGTEDMSKGVEDFIDFTRTSEFSVLRDDIMDNVGELVPDLYQGQMKQYQLSYDLGLPKDVKPIDTLQYNFKLLLDEKVSPLVGNKVELEGLQKRLNKLLGSSVGSDAYKRITHTDATSNFGLLKQLGYEDAVKKYPDVFKQTKVELYSKPDNNGVTKLIEYDLSKASKNTLLAHMINNLGIKGNSKYWVNINGTKQVFEASNLWDTIPGQFIKEGYGVPKTIKDGKEVASYILGKIQGKKYYNQNDIEKKIYSKINSYIKHTLGDMNKISYIDAMNADTVVKTKTTVDGVTKYEKAPQFEVVAYSPRYQRIVEADGLADQMDKEMISIQDTNKWAYDEESLENIKSDINIEFADDMGEEFNSRIELDNAGPQTIKFVDDKGKVWIGEGEIVNGERHISNPSKIKEEVASGFRPQTLGEVENKILDVPQDKTFATQNIKPVKLNIKKLGDIIDDMTKC